ncbi:MAG: GNAT family N-acetyltransferase [Sphingobacteriales bacterium]|nr:GNAT family N-acetyltransferase [Sphingobacteriales bacterium]MBI3719754.1 GNAT family N-acetyltransferase [Sphingobacteriales bacterium]
MEINYKTGEAPEIEKVIELYKNCGLPRPVNDKERMQKMYDSSNFIITAWDGDKLVGVCRCITDWAWCTYLADLAVHTDYQQHKIGKRLIDLTREKVEEETMILLLSVPTAFEYYPKFGFEKENRAFSIPRKKGI